MREQEETPESPELPEGILHDIRHPEGAPQLVKSRSEWDTILMMDEPGLDGWLAWHYATVMGLRFP